MIIEFDEQTSFQIKYLAKRAKIPVQEMVVMAVHLQAVIHSKYTPEEVLEFLSARD